jgi:hypothetical protein
MTAVCKEVRKKTIELLTRIKQKLKGSMSIITKMKNKRKWTNITNVLLDLIDEIQRYTKEKEDLGPFPLQWKALEALNWLLSLWWRWKCEMKELKLIHSSERWKAYEMVLIVLITKEWVSDNLNSITLQWIPWRNDGHSWLFIAKLWAIMQPLLNVKRCNVPTLGHHHRAETYDDQSSQMDVIASTGVFERHCGVQLAFIIIFHHYEPFRTGWLWFRSIPTISMILTILSYKLIKITEEGILGTLLGGTSQCNSSLESGGATLQDGMARSDFQWPGKPQGEIRRFSEVKRLIN